MINQKTVFLYPGQGAQHVGMGKDLYLAFPESRKYFKTADRALGFSLTQLCFEGPEEELNRDVNAQLAVYTISCIITDILTLRNINPDVVSGYSAGFYGAAYAAGCFDFKTGLDIVLRAGRILMDEGEKIQGTMVVIFGLSAETVGTLCEKTGNVWVSIINTPRQIIVSGLKASVEEVTAAAMSKGALDSYELPVATSYHTPLMNGARTKFLDAVKPHWVKKPQMDLYSYSSLKRLESGQIIREMMAEQLQSPVRWVDLIHNLKQSAAGPWYEIGPGMLIYRTVRWTDRGIEISTTDTAKKLTDCIKTFKNN